MDRVASPRLAPAEYETYFFSHNVTAGVTPNAARIRPLVFFFNTTGLFGDGTGSDPFAVEALEVDRLVVP